VTHVVWSEGKNKTLIKATELDLSIVTPLWMEECFQEGALVDEAKFLPPKMDEIVLKANNPIMKTITNQFESSNQQKKRSLASIQ
jgi:hypothetical protein